mgnify:CR=1 FL=1
MDENPYKAPEVAEVAAEAVISDPERIRREHLKHETSLKGAGLLMLVGALLVGISLLSVFGMPFVYSSGGGSARPRGPGLPILAVVGALLVLQLIAGVGLRRLAPWAWIPALIVSGLAVLNVPVGTLIGGYFLYLLIAPKGRRILAPDYREIMRLTPHIKYRTPWWMWLILIMVVLAVVGMFAWFSRA